MKQVLHILIFCFLAQCAMGQTKPKLEFDGQLSLVGSYAPNNDLDAFIGGRYISELSLSLPLDSGKAIDFEASANLSGAVAGHPFDTVHVDGRVSPYRMWGRYTTRQLEIRVGLQKIDFGSAAILRPLQWFNQIDPRDPLQLTNGVYAALGRYYFLNNANVWLWALYGNEKTRGFDAVQTYRAHPEFGGRLQHPVARGEIALSYHHRTANSTNLPTTLPQIEKIPEDRIAFDAKFDLKVGLWMEAVYIRKHRNVGPLTHQALLNIGTDYTFGIGNGLNVVVEHLLTSYDATPFQLANPAHITAMSARYPLGMYDNLSAVLVHSWRSHDFSFFLNYSHQFKHFTGYLMAFYNPDTPAGIQQNELVNQFAGPGIRIMAVLNH